MSIIVKNVTVPNCCASCQFAEEESLEWFTCYAQDCSLPMANRYVIDTNCPLTELPEHYGRLIDADVLIAEALTDGAYGYVDIKQIYDAPTIVEAE